MPARNAGLSSHRPAKIKQFKMATIETFPGDDALKADFQSSHEAPRSSLRVLTSN